MRVIRRVAFLGLCSSLVSCAAQPPIAEKTSNGPVSEAPLGQVELAPAPRLRSATPSYVQLARVEGYGNPKTGELWMRAVPLVEGFRGFEVGGPRPEQSAPNPSTTNGVGVSAQALGRVPGYCEATYEADGVPNNNPDGTLEFYNQYDASGNGADQSSFNAATCYSKLTPEFQTPTHNALFSSQGVGCALQHVGNFTGVDYNRLLLDVDVFNGSLATHGPYGPPFTTGTVTTPEGRNAPYQDLGLWDYGPMPSGSAGQTTGPHLKNMWVYFKNGDSNDFNWTGYILGEVFEECGDDDDDDCDGVDDNGCGTYADSAACFSNLDCASGFCQGAVVVSGQGEGGGELVDDVAGQCAPIAVRIDAGRRTTCRIVDGGDVECWGDATSALYTQAPTSDDNAEIALGLLDGCVVKKGGSLACWGSSAPITSAVPVGSDFRKVSVGTTHACALHDNGAVTCWGSDTYDEVGDAPASSDFIDISSGARHSCGVKHNGSIVCWGDGNNGQTSGPSNKVYVDVESGYQHNCALTASGQIDCWGNNSVGESNTPDSGPYLDLAVGNAQSCAVLQSGALECWGSDAAGQHTEPSGNDFVEIASGDEHFCAVRLDDSVVCWGDDNYQQTDVPAPVPTPELTTVSSGWYFGCAIMSDTGRVRCWGDAGGSSQALAGYPLQAIGVNAPELNLGSSRAVQLASGNTHSCAVFADKSVRCWGNNDSGQARGAAGSNVLARNVDPVPTPIDVGGPAVKVVTGAYHTCVLREDAKLFCWGNNTSGAIGMNSAAATIALDSAQPVPLGAPVADMCAGDYHNCALLQNGSVRCWGANASGELGLNGVNNVGDNEAITSVGVTDVLDGADLAGGRKVAKIACGSHSSCAVTDDGKLRCWGEGTLGALGYGNTADIGDDEYINTIGFVNLPEAVQQVTIGDEVTCVRLASGNTKCWGWTQRLASTSCLGHPAGCGSTVSAPPVTNIDFGGGRLAEELGYRSRGATLCARLDDDGVKCWHLNGASSIACGTNAGTATVNFPNGSYTLTPGVKIADLLLGQSGPGQTTQSGGATGLTGPIGIAVDPVSGKVFVADDSNRRVLRFASLVTLTNGAAAEAVLGQPDMTTYSGGTTASKMGLARGVAVDVAGRLWVADPGNSRVLRFDNAANKASGAAADAVLGQSTFTTSASAVSAAGMNQPTDIAVDQLGGLWVSDTINNRVLRFDNAGSKPNGAAADAVLGQATFVTSASGSGATGMYFPHDVHVDGLGRLWVSDRDNHRVLRFDSAHVKLNGDAADGVIGQADFASTSSATSATRLNTPRGLTTDSAGSLYVADSLNRRVLVFPAAVLTTNGPAANDVFGAPDFSSTAVGSSLDEMNYPAGLHVDASNRLWVVDMLYNRVTMYVQ